MELITYRKTLDVHKNGIQFTLQGFETNDNLSRRLEISLMASGDAVDFPLEGVVAMMYITTPNSTEPSIEHCVIRDNVVVYDVLPIVEEGTTEMQIKLIGARVGGAEAVLVSPRFAVEVLRSNADDGSAQQSTSFTALEDAVAKANAIYNARLLRIEVDSQCIFKAYYADGTVYESDEIRRSIMQMSTDVDLDAMIKNGIANFTADEVAEVLDEKYSVAFAKAIYSDNLANTYAVPTFVRWDADTSNTPFKMGLTTVDKGFALCYGDTLNHTVVALTVGDKGASTHIRRIVEGVLYEWQAYLTEQGGVIKGLLDIKKDWAMLSLSDEDGIRKGFVRKNPQNHSVELLSKGAITDNGDNYTMLELEPETANIEDMLNLNRMVDGEKSTFKIYGEHNVPFPAQIRYISYVGTSSSTDTSADDNQYKKKITVGFKPLVLLGSNKMATITGSTIYGFTVSTISRSGSVEWGDDSIIIDGVMETSRVSYNEKGRTYNFIIIGI